MQSTVIDVPLTSSPNLAAEFRLLYTNRFNCRINQL